MMLQGLRVTEFYIDLCSFKSELAVKISVYCTGVRYVPLQTPGGKSPSHIGLFVKIDIKKLSFQDISASGTCRPGFESKKMRVTIPETCELTADDHAVDDHIVNDCTVDHHIVDDHIVNGDTVDHHIIDDHIVNE